MAVPADHVRPTALIRLTRALDVPPEVVAADFSVATERDRRTKAVALHLKYLPDPGPVLTLKMNERTESIGVSGRPGPVARDFATTAADLDGAVREVRAWAQRIVDDIRAEPRWRAIFDAHRRVDELEERLDELPDEPPATAAEVSELRDWITEVEAGLRAQIEAFGLETADAKKRLEELDATFSSLKAEVERLTVRGMVRKVAARFWAFASDEDAGQMLENAQRLGKLLGSGDPE